MSHQAIASSNTSAAFCLSKLAEAARAAGVDTRDLPGVADRLGPASITIGGDRPYPLPQAIDVGRLSGDAGIFEVRVPHTAVLDLWEAVMRRAQDPGFPIFAATRIRPSDLDAIGFAFMTRATLREALHQCARYARLWADTAAWEVSEREGVVTASFTNADPGRLGARCLVETVLAQTVHVGRLLSGVDFAPREVIFRHASPRDTRAHAAFFRSKLRFEAGRSAIVMDAAVLDTPLPKADPELAAFFERHADALMRRCARRAGLIDRLRRTLAEELPRGLPTVELAAARLAQSPRTLRRRLQEEGTTFREILDETRHELAKRYLDEERIAFGEVAFLLGFSEVSAFHRAFKRWTGETPASYRRKRLVAA
jgi:AraC-like DNA-binding protein